MTPIIVIRPQPGCGATVVAAKAEGLAARGFPLFEIVPAAWNPPAPDGFDALLIGSANALAQAGPALARYAGMPAYAVGRRTAEAARAAGLTIAHIGVRGLQDALDKLQPGHLRLLRLAGRERVVLAPPAGVSMDERVVYASEPRPMPEALAELLSHPAVVLLHSAEAARHFASECAARGLPRGCISLAVIGPRVAEAASDGWAAVGVAEAPSDAAVLAQARLLCQSSLR